MSETYISTQILQENALFSGKNLHNWRKFYTTAGRDKSQLCIWAGKENHEDCDQNINLY